LTELVNRKNTAAQANPEREPAEAPASRDRTDRIQPLVEGGSSSSSDPNSPAPPNRNNPPPTQHDTFPPGTTRTLAGLRGDPDTFRELLVTPITLRRVKDVAQLDSMREELLQVAKKIEQGTNELELMQKRAFDVYHQTTALQKMLIAEYAELQEKKKKRRSDNVTPRNLDFATTTKPKSTHLP
jgi:hypothetical protein